LRWQLLTRPAVLAAVVSLMNAAKPVLIDDTAYLIYARHIADHPFDPYGFTVFWYTVPDPAMEVLCPPVLPYWLAAGFRLVGDHPPLLKLWLFPLVWVFAWSVRELLRRFARGTEPVALPLIVLSPAVLPTVNLMLDVPALGLGLAAVVLFTRAADSGSWRLAVAAGVVAALAVQTKYTMLLIPPLLAWYGMTHRRLGLAGVAVAVSMIAFAGWECFVFEKYGRSHFLFHLGDQQGGATLGQTLRDKAALLPPLAGHLGCLAAGVGLYAARPLGVPRRVVVLAAVLWAVGFAAVALLPHRFTVLVPNKLTLAAIVWRTAGTAALLAAAGCAAMLLFRRCPRPGLRHSADNLFVVGWVLLELAGYFALTPFPAARRVIGLTVAAGVLVARFVSRVSRSQSDRRPPRWVLPFGAAAGFLVAAIDTWDAYPEKVLAERASTAARDHDPAARVWYSGHWGFQWYCERAGMRPIVTGQTIVEPGDVLVLPVFPDEKGFYRPYPGRIRISPPDDAAARLAVITWDDPLAAQTVPNFYGGVDPVVGRDHPRLTVAVYRVTKKWAVGSG
jgi:hypothetical protein